MRYTAEEAVAFLDAIGPAGRSAYTRFLWLDLAVMVLLGGITLVLVVDWLRRRLAPDRSRLDWLALVPIQVSVFDAIENFALLLSLPAPANAAGTLTLASYATSAKHGIGRILMPSLVAGFGWLAIRRLVGRRRS